VNDSRAAGHMTTLERLQGHRFGRQYTFFVSTPCARDSPPYWINSINDDPEAWCVGIDVGDRHMTEDEVLDSIERDDTVVCSLSVRLADFNPERYILPDDIVSVSTPSAVLTYP